MSNTKKILFILLFSLFILLFVSPNIFAAGNEITIIDGDNEIVIPKNIIFNDNTIDFTTLDYVLFRDNSNQLFLFCTDEQVDSFVHKYTIGSYGVEYYDFYFRKGSESISSHSYKLSNNEFVSCSSSDTGGKINYVLSSTIDCYKQGSNTPFFQLTPLELIQVKTGTLAPIMEQVEMSAVLAEIVKLLPLIIVVVVSLVGLHKGLMLLFQVLHQA